MCLNLISDLEMVQNLHCSSFDTLELLVFLNPQTSLLFPDSHENITDCIHVIQEV